MIRAYDSTLEHRFVGEGEPPYFCPRCGNEVVPGPRWFDHPDPHCYEFTELGVECLMFLYDNVQGIELDTILEGRLVPARMPTERVVVPPPLIPRTKLRVKDMTEYWNRAGQAPLWIFGGPGSSRVRDSKLGDGAKVLKATGAEQLIIDALESERNPYLSWNGKELVSMDVFSRNDKMYFGYMRILDASRIRLDRTETDIGRLAVVKDV